LQLYVESMEPRGQGALYLAFEQLKRKLSAEGLFAEERKRALPFLPVSIGIVTSEKGAALRDMLRIIGDRYPDRRIVVWPVKVQGVGAAEEIAKGITELGRSGEVDVMIVGRGGGSLEDLWAFNEEIVARSISMSPVPVISAVGHEIDFTIADFVADLRAPTPTAAAEIAVPRKSELVGQVMDLEEQLARCMWRRLELAKENWRGFVKRLADPERKLRETQQRVDELSVDLVRRFRDRMRQVKDRFVQGGGRLDALSPLAVLDRGYSIVHKIPEEKLVKDTTSLDLGDFLRVTFAKGKAICRVERKE
jgi:exodeoxyribonuclease VII large subunit